MVGQSARVRLTVRDPAPAGDVRPGPATPRPALVAEVTAGSVASLRLHPGTDLWAGVKATEVSAYPS